MKPKEGYKGYVCKRCGSLVRPDYQLPAGTFICSNPNCDCQAAEWVTVE